MASSSGPTQGKPSLSGTLAKIRKYIDNPKKVQEALIIIRKTFLKEKTGIDRLRHYGGVATLFEITQGSNETCTNIALSILGNICMDTKVQLQVINGDGITALGKVINESNNSDVINRACRTLSNLAQNPIACRMVHDVEYLVAKVVEHLVKTEDTNLKLTLIRTIRVLSDTPSHRTTVLSEEGLRAIALCLKSEDERVLVAAYQNVMMLSKEFNDTCARQIVAADAPAAVLGHFSQDKEVIRKMAFKILMHNWMGHHEMRVAIGNAGGIPYFIKKVQEATDTHQRLINANALCLSCCEVVNRVRVKDNNGLPMMLEMLQSKDYSRIHDRLISALTCFLYDESSWEIMMKNNLVSIVISHLKRVANLEVLCKQPVQKWTPTVKIPTAVVVTTSSSKIVSQETSSSSKKKEACSQPRFTIVEPSTTGNLEPGTSDIIKQSTSDIVEPSTSDIVKPSTSDFVEPSTSDIDQLKTSGTEIEHSVDQSEINPDMKDKSTIIRYSVDSPTYKSVVDWTPEDYMSGPKNILDSERYQCGSPDRLSGYSSPSNYGPYSPLSVSSLDLSPDTSPLSLRSISPALSSPGKNSPSSPGTSSYQSSNRSPIWSPAHSSQEDESSVQLSDPNSPDIISQTSSFFFVGSADPFLDERLQFSSSDDDETNAFVVVNDNDDTSNLDLSSLDSTSVNSLSSGVSVLQRLNSDTSDTDASTDSRLSLSQKRTPLSSKVGTKRKREVTPEMRKRIMLNVEKSQNISSTLDLTKMLSSNVIDKTSEIRKERERREKEVPTNKKDHRRQTEYCLVMLIKKVSCSADPTEHLIKLDVLGTLMDYVSFAEKPFSKCGRIIVRLAKNTECFEAMILELLPQLIEDRLVKKIARPTMSTQRIPAAQGSSSGDSTIKPPEGMNRSMSSCTLKESSKVLTFHREVKEQTKKQIRAKSFRYLKSNRNEALKLKETLFSDLSFIAETPFGQGVLEHLLLTGTESEKIKTAVALTLICRSKSLQTKMYIDFHGLQHLSKALNHDDENLQRHALHGLCVLAAMRSKKSPSTKPTLPIAMATFGAMEESSSRMSSSAVKCSAEDDRHDTVFKLDDGSEIPACRELLGNQSQVFKAMLQGHYSEAKQTVIKMPEVSKDSFQIIIDHLHNKAFKDPNNLDVVLEAHGLADRYIMDALSRDLCDLVITSHLQLNTLHKIFTHAVLHENFWVMRKCVSFLLVDSSVNPDIRLKKMKELLSSKEGEVVVDVIEDIFRFC